jgi:hypothetical protein
VGNQFASAKWALGICDRCGQTYKLKQLKGLVVKTKNINILVCPTCWEPDQPQLSLGLYPVDDPQALQNARPDTNKGTDIGWGWNPVGLYNPLGLVGLVDVLQATGQVGSVTVVIG